MSTKIEWTDRTWNPTRGCSLVSEGCRHCYAMKFAHRFSAEGKPYAGLTELGPDGPRWTGKIRLVPDALEEPLHWRKPQKVFVNSMSDLFHEDVPFEFIDRVFGIMACAPRHTFQILTKRPKRMREYFAELGKTSPDRHIEQRGFDTADFVNNCVDVVDYDTLCKIPDGLSNVWLGVSVEDQKTADERIPLLLQTPAAIRFISYEPALGPIDFVRFPLRTLDGGENPGIDWLIVGGESGPGARPMHPDWARSAQQQCEDAGVAYFFKQWGEWFPRDQWEWTPEMILPDDGDARCEDARTRILDDLPFHRVGKKAAGRLLDGQEWNEYP